EEEGDEKPQKVVDFKEKVKIKTMETSPDKVITADQLKTLIEKGVLEEVLHTVEPGDCSGCIAEKYDLTKQDIIRLNPDLTEETLLQLDQEINVTAAKPLLTVKSVETFEEDVVLDYTLEVETSEEMYRGDSRVTQEGEEGLKKVTYQITKENGEEVEKKVLNEEIVAEPVNKVIIKGTKVKPDRGSGSFMWPTNGGRISSGYGTRSGRMHKG